MSSIDLKSVHALQDSGAQHDCCALVLGLCSHGLAIARSLHRQGIEVHALESNTRTPGFKTRSATVHRVHSINEDSLVGDLLAFRAALPPNRQIVLFPTNDNNVKILAEHIKRIEEQFILSWSSSAATVRKLLLKSNIEERCMETGLLYPRSAIVNDYESLQDSLSGLGSPFIVKPVKPQSRFKALKFHNQSSLLKGLRQYPDEFPVIIQEWIKGTAEDLYFCALYLDHGKALGSFVGRKLDSYPPALGQTTVAVSHRDDQLLELTHRFFDGLEISGPVSVEFKRDQEGRYWVIEPTVGRSDFWLGLCIGAGYDLPVLEYQVSIGIGADCIKPPSLKNTIWFDSDRDPAAPARYSYKWFGFSKDTYKPVFSYLSPTDPLPFLRASYQTLRRLTATLLRRRSHNAGGPQSSTKANNIKVFSSFEALPDKFRDILQVYAEDCTFFDITWFENFNVSVASKIGSVEILCLSDSNGDALAVLPLIRYEEIFHGIKLRKVSSMSNYYTPRFDIFTDENLCDRRSAFQSFIDYLQDSEKAWDVAEIFPMFRESITDIRGIARLSFPYYITENYQQPIETDYASYISSRPSRHVNTLKRKQRKLAREKNYSIDINCGDEHILEIMSNYHEVYHKSWKIDEPYPDFIDGLVKWATKKGSLRMGRLIIDEEVVAAQIWVVANEAAYIYKLAYDRSYQQYSPGTLLTSEMLKHVIDQDGVHRVDFLLGNDSFKNDWMDVKTSFYGVQFPNLKTPRGLALAIINAFSGLKRSWMGKKSWFEPTD